MSFTPSDIRIWPDDSQGALVEIPELPVGATVDNIFYFEQTVNGSPVLFKRVLTGTMRAANVGIFGNGTGMAVRLQEVADAGLKTIVFDSPVDKNFNLDGAVELPDDFIMAFSDGNKIGGEGIIIGGIVDCHPLRQCFDLADGLVVMDLFNTEIHAEWFGVRADALFDGTTVSPTDNAPLLQAAINAGVNRYTGEAYVFRAKVIIGACPRGYCFYLGSTILWNCSMEFAGAGRNSTIFVSPDGVGFRYTYPVDVDNTGAEYFTARDFSVFGAFSFYCPGYFDEDFNGIEIDNTNGDFHNIRVSSFKGNGWTFHGSGAGVSIADNNILTNCSAYQCGGDGVEFSGGDANNNTLILFNAYGNARLGDDDNSFLGNDVDLHAAANGVENTFNRSSVSYLGNRYFCKVDNNINHLPTDTDYWHLNEAGPASAFFPAWDNATEYFIGGDFNLRGPNQKGTLTGTYSEGGQYQPPNGGRNVITGGFGAGDRAGSLSVEQGVLTTPDFKAFNSEENLGIALLGAGYNKLGVYDYDNSLFPGWSYDKTQNKFLYSTGPGGPPSSSQTELLMAGSNIAVGTKTKSLVNKIALYSFFLARFNIGDYRLIQGRTIIPGGLDEPSNAGEIALDLSPDCTNIGWKCIANTDDNSAGTWIPIARGADTTANRPAFSAATNIGYQYFDTTLGYPIWWNGTIWVKSDGTAA